jgi:hypothetical protein
MSSSIKWNKNFMILKLLFIWLVFIQYYHWRCTEQWTWKNTRESLRYMWNMKGESFMGVQWVDNDVNFADLLISFSIILKYILEERERTGISIHSKQKLLFFLFPHPSRYPRPHMCIRNAYVSVAVNIPAVTSRYHGTVREISKVTQKSAA